MQTVNTTNTLTHGIREHLDRFFASVGQGFNSFLVTLSRARELERLNALSDRQLAEMGLNREDIVRHVFRNKFYA